MAKLSDVFPKDEMDPMQAEWDALSEEERQARTREKFAELQRAIGKPVSGLVDQIGRVAAQIEPPDDPEFDSPFQKMLDVMKDLHAEQTRSNKATGRLTKWTLIVASLALLTNLLPTQDWMARLW